MGKKVGDRFYLVPPAGTPVSFRDILNMVKLRFQSGSLFEGFEEMIKGSFDAKYCFLYNSGRTAMASILNSLNRLSSYEKDEVVIPAYTCFSVAAAVVRSGLKIRLVDIDPLTMDYDYGKLRSSKFDKTLAIVGCNLFGIISDWNVLKEIADAKNVFLVDDAAQSMGSFFGDKASGNLGDAGFYSLGRGKNLSTVSGGILVTDSDQIASDVRRNLEGLKKNGTAFEMRILLEIIFYAAFLNPGLYWLPDKMPFLKLGQTVFDEKFSMSRLSNLQKCAGSVMLPKLGEINAARLRNATSIADILSKDGRFQIPGYSIDRRLFYLRVPILAPGKRERDRAIEALMQAGIKSSEMYPSTIREIEGIEKHLVNPDADLKGARVVVDRLFTLPTHSYVKDRDIEKIIDILRRI